MGSPSASTDRHGALCGLDPLELLRHARSQDRRLAIDGLQIRLSEDFGFCQGVERAVELALRAARAVEPGSSSTPRLFVTGEIIHNPAVHEELRRAGLIFLAPAGTPGRLAGIRPEDSVIIPAFGNPREEEEQLRRIGCTVIDTTCGWVRRVWRAAQEFAAAGLTIVIHGRADHEETRATASRIDGPWVVVRDGEQAERLAQLVAQRPGTGEPGDLASAEVFAARVGAAVREGFDPARDLARLGLVNQTTMLSSETQAIATTLRRALEQRLGQPPDAGHFRTLETFCPATERRQDAVRRMIAAGEIDCLIVVGGFRSSNTAHLAQLGAARVPSFHVEDATCLIDRTTIRHLPPGAPAPVLASGWLPAAPATIGVTAGASTPDRETGMILQRLIALHRGRPCGAEGPA